MDEPIEGEQIMFKIRAVATMWWINQTKNRTDVESSIDSISKIIKEKGIPINQLRIFINWKEKTNLKLAKI